MGISSVSPLPLLSRDMETEAGNQGAEGEPNDSIPKVEVVTNDSDHAPLLAPVHHDKESEANLSNRHKDLTYLGCLTIVLLIFIFLFGLLFKYLERDNDWTYIDGWFFAVVTIGTVGYGVLTPSNDWTRGFVVLFLCMGVVMLLFTMALITDVLLAKMEGVTRRLKLHTCTPCGPRVFGLVTLLLMIVGSGVIYGVVGEDWNFVESMYWTIVTITTVGYGDYAPSTQIGRLVISFFILIAGGCFAAVLCGVVANYISIRHRAAALNFMMGNMTTEKLANMPKNSQGLVSRMEFLEHMLIKLAYVPHGDLQLIHA